MRACIPALGLADAGSANGAAGAEAGLDADDGLESADDGLLEAIATELRSFGLNAVPSDPLLRPPAWSATFVLTTCATVAGSIGEPPDDEQTAKANAGEPKTHDRSQALP